MIKSIKEKEKEIYKNIKEYFDLISIKDLKPSSWRVPIGGGFYGADEVNGAVECYLHGSLSIQKSVASFENEFSKYVGTKYGIATNSGTSANILALNALMDAGYLKKGDEVAVPATTFISVVTPIIQLGLVPVYIDVRLDTLNIDPNELKKAIQDKSRSIKCVIVVHTLGNPADMTRIMEIANRKNIKIIEDCCEAHGAEWGGKKVGSYGIISTWSFYVAHNMTTAEGGMVLTNSTVLNTILTELREFGRNKGYKGERYGMSQGNLKDFDERYTFHRIGWNFRMADAPAAFGRQQLKKLDQMNETRIENAKYLTNKLSVFGEYIHVLPENSGNNINTYYSFPILIKDVAKIPRKEIVQYLESSGVETRAIMCGTLSDQPSLCSGVGIDYGDLKHSRYIRDNGFFIGCHPCLDYSDLEYTVKVIRAYFNKKGLA